MIDKENLKVIIGIILVFLVFLSSIIFRSGKSKENLQFEDTKSETRFITCFSPDGECEDMVSNILNEADKEIVCAMYIFSSRNLANTLARKSRDNISVKVLLDGDMASSNQGILSILRKGGVDIVLEKNPFGSMHNKYIVVDSSRVITGSFDWVYNADRKNYENIIIIESIEIANKYRNDFQLIWDEFI